MRQNYPRIDKALFIGIMLFLFIPLLQSTFKVKKNIRPLNGAFAKAEDTAFGGPAWFSGRYQALKNEYLKQNFGFRNSYVRLNNQLDFTLFKKINTEHVIAGKADVYFEENYIDAYYGNNFVGKENLDRLAGKLKQAQDILRSYNIALEILFLPGKASFYPEYIPEERVQEKKPRNYDYLVGAANAKQLDFIDFNAWFRQLKGSTVHDLYPAGGIHWSNYGALLAYDSLLKHIEQRTPVSLRSPKIEKIEFSDKLRDPDNDIVEALNLIRNPPMLSMPYAQYRWTERPGVTRPAALFIGDSYFWNWYHQGLVNNTFTDARFWYYCQTIYPDTLPEREVKGIDFRKEVEKNKVVVLMATETNIHDIGWGFADKVIQSFPPKGPVTSVAEDDARRRIYISYFSEEIRKTPAWLASVEQKAKEKGISAEAMIALDAAYLYDNEYSSAEVIAFTEDTKARIRNDANWMKDIRRKAKEKGISVDKMLELDAKYIYEMEVKEKK